MGSSFRAFLWSFDGRLVAFRWFERGGSWCVGCCVPDGPGWSHSSFLSSPLPPWGILRRCALVSMICRLASLVKYCIQEVYPQNIDDKRLTGSSHDARDDCLLTVSFFGLKKEAARGRLAASFLSLLSIANWRGGMRHANLLVWRGDLLVWGLTGVLLLTVCLREKD
jgi:hypothetical protein